MAKNIPLVAPSGGTAQEAVERTREAEAYRREAMTKRFNGNKDAAEKYLADRVKRGRSV